MSVTLYVRDEDPEIAARILRERALLRHEGRVYVKPHVRAWPGGIVAARKAERRERAREDRKLPPWALRVSKKRLGVALKTS
jgi:hypothetical protein